MGVPSRTKVCWKEVRVSLAGGSCPFSRYPRYSALREATTPKVFSTAPAIAPRYQAGFSAFTWTNKQL